MNNFKTSSLKLADQGNSPLIRSDSERLRYKTIHSAPAAMPDLFRVKWTVQSINLVGCASSASFLKYDVYLMTNYRSAHHPGGTFFFTVVTYRRRKILTFPESRTFLRQAIRQTQEKYRFRIDALEDALKSTSYLAALNKSMISQSAELDSAVSRIIQIKKFLKGKFRFRYQSY